MTLTVRPINEFKQREDIVGWIDGCMLGDLRTLRNGIAAREASQVSDDTLGGGNFLLAAGCFMALEYMSTIYNRGENALDRFRQFARDHLAIVNQRYRDAAGVLWRCFRDGIVHASWPQSVFVQEQFGERIVVGVGNMSTDPHLEPLLTQERGSLIISGPVLLSDIEQAFAQSFRGWLLSKSDDGVLVRAAPRALELTPDMTQELKELQAIRAWPIARAASGVTG